MSGHTGAKGARRDARPRLPHQIPPTRIEQDYAAALIRMIGRLRAAYAPLLRELPSILDEAAEERGDTGRADAVGRGFTRLDAASSRAKKLLAQARAAPVIDTRALEALAGKYAKATSDHQKEQIRRQAHAAIKVDPVFRDSELAPLARHFVAENVALIKRIPRRLHDDVEALVHGAVARGHRHKHLTKQIEDRFGVAEKHARLIARDQIGKFHAKVNHHRQREMGVKKFVWRTVDDERVRPWHEELDDTEHSYAKPPRNPETGERVLPGEDIQCFPGRTLVSSQAPVTKLYRRWYRGESAVLHTDDGRLVESTPNHPLLTARGWVAAQDIQIGDYIVQAFPERLAVHVQDRERRDTSLSELFDALAPFGLMQPRRSLHRGFHGDAPLDQQVDVVGLDWSLPLELDVHLSQTFCEQILILADESTTRQRNFSSGLQALGDTPRSFVRGARELGSLLGAGLAHSLKHRRAAIAWLDTVTDKLRAHGCTRDAEVLRDALRRPPAFVEGPDLIARILARVVRRAMARPPHDDAPRAERLAEVVRVYPAAFGGLLQRHGLYELRRVVENHVGQFVGHVYNLETASGWYVADDVVVHNCRCSAEPVFE